MWQSGYSNLEVREWGEVIHILSLKTRELRWGGGGGEGGELRDSCYSRKYHMLSISKDTLSPLTPYHGKITG